MILDEFLTCVQFHPYIYVETWLHYLREHTSILSVILILFATLALILIFNRKHIDMKKVEQVQMMQRLAKQQHELMEFIAKTEELVLKIETNADLSYSDIMEVKGHMNQWCEGLETLEEKKKRIMEEKKVGEREKRAKEEAEKRRKEKEEREKREKEEAEKRRKENEEREAEEKRRKLEKQKNIRDWKNWPPFM
jgi:hypothetical protein